MSVDAGGEAQDLAAAPPTASLAEQTTPGGLLRAAREESGLSVQQVADDLHLDVRLVDGIESNNFELLGPPVYSRGHLRKYAMLLGLSPDVVISRYELLTDVPVVPEPIPVTVMAPPPQRVSLRIPVMIVTGIVVAGALLALAGWLVDRFDSGPAQVSDAQPVELRATSGESQDAVASATVSPEVDQQEASDQEPAAAATPALADVPLADSGNSVSMRLRFSEASWVEVYDATGERLMYEIGQPGQTRTLSGESPLRVTLGLASAVTLEVNDRTVPVPRRSGRDAARFTVAADGSVR